MVPLLRLRLSLKCINLVLQHLKLRLHVCVGVCVVRETVEVHKIEKIALTKGTTTRTRTEKQSTAAAATTTSIALTTALSASSICTPPRPQYNAFHSTQPHPTNFEIIP